MLRLQELCTLLDGRESGLRKRCRRKRKNNKVLDITVNTEKVMALLAKIFEKQEKVVKEMLDVDREVRRKVRDDRWRGNDGHWGGEAEKAAKRWRKFHGMASQRGGGLLIRRWDERSPKRIKKSLSYRLVPWAVTQVTAQKTRDVISKRPWLSWTSWQQTTQKKGCLKRWPSKHSEGKGLRWRRWRCLRWRWTRRRRKWRCCEQLRNY